eukprot:Hpha_TRINITY_DN16693_c2_g6::TRINITY_DN16693_c2_g6_i1::g.180594::m.180594
MSHHPTCFQQIFCCASGDAPPTPSDTPPPGLSWDSDNALDPASPQPADKSPRRGLVAERERESMTVGVPAEIDEAEFRVAVTPDGVRELRKAGFNVVVEAGAGEKSGFDDGEYQSAGARLGGSPDEAFATDVVMKVRPPAANAALGRHEADMLVEGRSLLLCGIHPERSGALMQRLSERRVTVVALNKAPRGSAYDVDTSTAAIAGYNAIVEAAAVLHRPFSGPPPVQVLVIGSGAAAVSAARAARGLGATVRVLYWKAREEMEELAKEGCQLKQLKVGGDGAALLAELSQQLRACSVVVSAAGSRTFPIISTADLGLVAPGGVVVDIGGGAGGDVHSGSGPPGVTVIRGDELLRKKPRQVSVEWSRCAVTLLLRLSPPGDPRLFGVDLRSVEGKHCVLQYCTDERVLKLVPSRSTRHRRWLRRRSVPVREEGEKEAEEEADGTTLTWWGIVSIASPEWPLITLGCVLTVVKVPFSLAVPHFAAAATGALFHKKRATALWSIKALIVCGVVEMGIGMVASVVMVSAQQRVVRRVRGDLFHNLMSQDGGFFDSVATGVLASRLEVDTAEMASDLTWVFSSSLDSTARIVGITVYMLAFSPQLAVIVVSAVPVAGAITYFFAPVIQSTHKELQTKLAGATDVSAEVFTEVNTVTAAGTEEYETRRYRRETEKVYDASMNAIVVTTAYTQSTDLTFLITHAMTLLAGVGLVMSGTMEPTALITFSSYQAQFRASVLNLFDIVSSFARTTGAGARVWLLLHRKPAPCAHPDVGSLIPETPRGAVSFKNVSFVYASRPGVSVLKGLSFEAPAGEVTAIVGHTGSGKSTVLGLLKRRYAAGEGEVSIDGINVMDICPGWMKRKVAVVSQEPALLGGSVAHNILYTAFSEDPDLESRIAKDAVLRAEWYARIQRAAERAGAWDFIQALPHGLGTEVGERGKALSGGQKQRVAIARALLLDPALLLMDEATSALDAESERAVTDTITSGILGCTVVLIAQRPGAVRGATNVVVMDQGEVVEQGPPSSLQSEVGRSMAGGGKTV